MYAVNDTILYGTLGVCRIEGIRRETIGGASHEYYVLKPMVSNRSTIYVPTDNETLVDRMRPILSADESCSLIRSIPKLDALWIENEAERKEAYQELMHQGNPTVLVQIVKALYLQQQRQHAKGRKLHIADQHFFKLAEKLLYEEFAVSLQIELDQVQPFIQEQIGLEQQHA